MTVASLVLDTSGLVESAIWAFQMPDLTATEADFEEIDHWLNCHNVPCAIDVWYDRIADFKAARQTSRERLQLPLFFALGGIPLRSKALPTMQGSRKGGVGLDVETVRAIVEPFSQWKFLSSEQQRALLTHLCPEIMVYRFQIKGLRLNLGNRYENSPVKKVVTIARAVTSRTWTNPLILRGTIVFANR